LHKITFNLFIYKEAIFSRKKFRLRNRILKGKMTDPFKKQRYSSPSMSKSSPSHVANTLSTIEENTFNKYTSSAFSMLPNEDSGNATRSSFYERNLSHEKKPHQQQQQMPLNQQENEQAAFVRAHLESNKELIAQLKSNIELLFKASKYVLLFDY